jgi:hypothetical protein
MPLRYDLTNICDWQSVCYIDTDTGRKLNPVTNALILNDVGYREIKAAESAYYFERLCMRMAITGAPMMRCDGSDWYITQDDVIAHIGLVTNHRSLNEGKFNIALVQLLEDKAKQLRIQLRCKVKV